ncbi:MAG: Rho termination factor N-terminal domain-containing protein, partial [bacterium]
MLRRKKNVSLGMNASSEAPQDQENNTNKDLEAIANAMIPPIDVYETVNGPQVKEIPPSLPSDTTLDLNKLYQMHIGELNLLARSLGITDYSLLPKSDLIFKILEKRSETSGFAFASGVLEVLSEGYGFLRTPKANFLPGPDDVYVSPSQIKRFALRTGHIV